MEAYYSLSSDCSTQKRRRRVWKWRKERWEKMTPLHRGMKASRLHSKSRDEAVH